MKNRASSHLLVLLLIIGLEAVGYVGVYRAGLIRGYEPSTIAAVRDFFFYIPIIFLVFWLTRAMRFAGNWTLYTTAVLLFSVGLLVQYRLYSDPQYGTSGTTEARASARAARARMTQIMRERYINDNYDEEKRRIMGMPQGTAGQTQAEAMSTSEPGGGDARFSIKTALLSSNTWVTLLAFLSFAIAYWLCARDSTLLWIQRHSFVIAITTLIPLTAAAIAAPYTGDTRGGGKFFGMTPWEVSKIPFLLGFAGILTAHYKSLSQTYWGLPRARDVLPLVLMGVIPFIPFFVLSDFGQLLVFSGAYATLYLASVRRWPQLLLFVGSLVLGVGILVVASLPPQTQARVPFLSTLSAPVQKVLPNRIRQRFYLWINGFEPPPPDIDWWRNDFSRAIERDTRANGSLQRRVEESPESRRAVNIDVWFGGLAFQPAQATFGIAAGGLTGRGLGLGFAELVPEADSDYVYAAIAEEFGIVGGAVVILGLIIFVYAGMRTALDARDMFTKLCSAGLTAFIGFQALVNVGGITRALPMTGITFPFVSHGGFSLIASFAMLGMLMAFSHRNARDAQAAPVPAVQPTPRQPDDYVIPEAVQ